MLDPADLLGVVREDLRFITTEFNDRVADDSLRRASAVLRRLLVDGELQRAWRLAGFAGQPTLRAVNLDRTLEGVDRARVVIATAGGALFQGLEVAGMLVRDYAVPESEINSRHEAEPPYEDVRLLDFVQAPCVVIRERVASRQMIVKYIANKLGGAHHDAKRKNDDQELMFASLDRLARDDRLLIADKPVVYFELLAIGQALAASADIQRLANP